MKGLKSFLKKFTWIIVAVGISVFFIVALSVYIKVEPNNVTELLNRDDTWLSREQLSSMSGDLEAYPYVTKVYEYGTNLESLNINYIGVRSDKRMVYGIIEDSSIEFNYFVECFLYCEIANRSSLKQIFKLLIVEDEVLKIQESSKPYIWYGAGEDNGDIITNSSIDFLWIDIFMRITVKPGYDSIKLLHNGFDL